MFMLTASAMMVIGLVLGQSPAPEADTSTGDPSEWKREALRLSGSAQVDVDKGRRPALEAAIEYNPKQRAKGGIVLIVELSNAGPEAVNIAGVGQFINVLVYDSHGARVDVQDPQLHLIPKRTRRRGVPEEKHKERTRVGTAFKLMDPPRTWKDPRIKIYQEAVNNDDAIRLDPGERFQMALLVDKIMCNPENWWAEIKKRSVPIKKAPPDLGPMPPVEVCPPAPGEYKILISFRGFHCERYITVELVESWPPEE